MAGDVHRLREAFGASNRAGRPAGRPSAPRRSNAPGCRAGPSLLAMRSKTRLQLAGLRHVERQRRSAPRARARAARRAACAFSFEVGDGEIGAELAERLRRSRRRSSARWRCRTTSAFVPFRIGRGMLDVSWRRTRFDVRCSSAADQPLRVARDHQLLVGRDHPRRHPARRRADARAAVGVGRGVELDAEPGRVAADALADRAPRARRCRR